MLFPRGQDFSAVEPPSKLSVITHSVREYGIGICGAAQSPGMISEASVRTQSHFKFIISNLGSNTDYEDMANIMNFNEDQLEWAKSHGRVGRAIAKLTSGPFCEPFLIDIPYLNLKNL